jgi:hypothetical protein
MSDFESWGHPHPSEEGLHLKGTRLYAVAYEGPGFDLKGSASGA